MAKQPRVWTGTQWDTLAVTLPDLSNYSTTTQMNTAITNNVGLVPIVSTTFTAQTAVTVSNCFTSTYKNYLVIFNSTAYSSSGTATLQLTTSGTASTVNYSWGFVGVNQAGSGANSSGSNLSAWTMFDYDSSVSYGSSFNLNILDPQLAQHTKISRVAGYHTGSAIIGSAGGGYHSINTSYDGFKMNFSGGTASGTLKVYGYKD